MKSATLPLQNRYANFLAWLGFSHTKKEKISLLTKKEKNQHPGTVDWTKSSFFTRDRSKERMMTAEEVAWVLGRDPENFK